MFGLSILVRTAATFPEDASTAILAWLTGILAWLEAALSGVVVNFWDAITGFTIYGYMLMFAIASMFVTIALGFVFKLVRK